MIRPENEFLKPTVVPDETAAQARFGLVGSVTYSGQQRRAPRPERAAQHVAADRFSRQGLVLAKDPLVDPRLGPKTPTVRGPEIVMPAPLSARVRRLSGTTPASRPPTVTMADGVCGRSVQGSRARSGTANCCPDTEVYEACGLEVGEQRANKTN